MRVVGECWKLFRLAAAALAILPLAGRADVITLNPSADSYIREFAPDFNAGGELTLVSGCLGDTANREIRRAFLRFDLSQIPAGATINSVTLNVTVVMVPRIRADSNFDVRRVLSQWSEADISWNSRLAGVGWQVPGADGPGDTSPNASSTVTILGLGAYTFPSTAGLVSDVQTWVNNPGSNFGWILVSEDEATPRTARRFGSHEDPFNTPVLTVIYTAASLSATVQPSEQTVLEGSTVTFTSQVTGNPPIGYQWLFNGGALAGATTDTLVLSNVQTNQSGLYAIAVSNISGSVTSAPATLTVTNQPAGLPFVRVTSPTNGARFPALSPIVFSADASESNGTITRVEFLLGTNSEGFVTSAPYTITVSNLVAGTYSLAARATDDRGSNAISPSVSFTVVNPPGVYFTSPAENARFALGTNVPIAVNVISNGARITNVSFYAASFDETQGGLVTNLIGTATAPPYSLNWMPDVAGDYALSAVVQNEFGQTGASTNVDIRVFIAELILPVIAVTEAPPSFSRVTSSPIQISGTANDNVGIDHIEYQIVSGPLLQTIGKPVSASGTSQWIAEVALAPGKNAVRFYSIDLAGNKSRVVTLFYTYFATAPLSIQINGSGTVTPNLNGRNLELGKRYAVTARPAAGFIFAGWNNVTPSNSPTASFQMAPEMVITANFVANPFLELAGSYNGLFFDPDPQRLRPESSGLISFFVTRQGAFSGRLTIQKAAYGFGGRFDPLGHAQFSIPRAAKSPILVSLAIDADPNAASANGSVSVSSDAVSLSSLLLAKRNVFASGNPSAVGADVSFSVQRVSDTGVDTVASGLAEISRVGGIALHGRLADGRPFNRITALGGDGTAPLYLAFSKQEIFIGWLGFEIGEGGGLTANGQILHALPATPAVEVLQATSP